MPSYAILGATGSTGQSLVRQLMQSPDNQIRAYCRSSQKLHRLIPEVAEQRNVQIFEGSLDNVDLIADCIRGTRAVFLVVAAAENIPGCTIAQDTAHSVLAALQQLKGRDVKPVPRLVVLSAAPLEPKFAAHIPRAKFMLISYGCSYIYYDLQQAEKLLRANESWVSTTFIKPGALSPGGRRGYFLSTEKVVSPITYSDLAAGMIEVADAEDGKWNEKNVSVSATTQVSFSNDMFYPLLRGVLFHFMPWTYSYIL